MKQKDFLTIGLIVFISGLISYFVANALIGSPSKHNVKVEKVEAISSDFNKPDSKYFNAQSINPTKLIEIGDGNNQKPFN